MSLSIDNGPRALTRRRALVLLALIPAVGLAWRCYAIASRSLWFDEAFTYFVSRVPLSETMHRIRLDRHPPLHFLLMKAWMQVFGNSPLALRFPSLLCGALAIAGVYLFTVESQRDKIGGDGVRSPATPRAREIGLWAAALVALSVFQIRASWEVRMYALGAALAAFSSWALIRALHARPGRHGYWLLYVALALLFAYTHYFALFTIAAQGLFAIGYLVLEVREQKSPPTFLRRFIRHPQFLPGVLAATVLCLGWLPWLPTFLAQQQQGDAGSWVQPASLRMAGGYAFHMLVAPEAYPTPEDIPVAVCSLFVCAAIPLALVWKATRTESFVILAIALPIGASLAASVFFDVHIFFSRYFLFAHLFLLVAAAFILAKIRRTWARMLAGAVLTLLMFGADFHYLYRLSLNDNPSYRGVVEYIQSHREPDEPVVVCDQIYFLPLLYHSDGAHGWYLFGHSSSLYDDARTAMGPRYVMRAERLDNITDRRVWVINAAPDSAVEVPASWVARPMTVFVDTYGTKQELQIVEYEVPAHPKR
jgi:4-amino-4-deoxy-L-arabinose transferase-like glycosyltransferase